LILIQIPFSKRQKSSHLLFIFDGKNTINSPTILSLSAEICSHNTKNMTLQQNGNDYTKQQRSNNQDFTQTRDLIPQSGILGY